MTQLLVRNVFSGEYFKRIVRFIKGFLQWFLNFLEKNKLVYLGTGIAVRGQPSTGKMKERKAMTKKALQWCEVLTCLYLHIYIACTCKRVGDRFYCNGAMLLSSFRYYFWIVQSPLPYRLPFHSVPFRSPCGYLVSAGMVLVYFCYLYLFWGGRFLEFIHL